MLFQKVDKVRTFIKTVPIAQPLHGVRKATNARYWLEARVLGFALANSQVDMTIEYATYAKKTKKDKVDDIREEICQRKPRTYQKGIV